MKKILLLLLAPFLLTSCFGGNADETDNTEPVTPPSEQISFYRPVNADNFVIQVPEDWETIQTFPTNYPENTYVAFRNNIQENDFIANINIVRNSVEEGTNTADYALQVYETIASQLVNFKNLESKEYDLYIEGKNVKTYLYKFEGTNDPTQKSREFIQLTGVKGPYAYIVTGAYDKNDTELAIDQINQSIKTFYLP